MGDSLNHQDCRKFLSAFADGELDVEQNLRVLEQLTMDPRTTARVVHQQQLRKMCCCAMSKPDKAPVDVRRCVAKMILETPVPATEPATTPDMPMRPAAAAPRAGVLATLGGPSTPWWTGRAGWAALAAAAVLLIAGAFLASGMLPTGSGGDGNGTQLVVSAPVELFSTRHVRCSRGLEQLYAADRFPREVQMLPAALEPHLRRPAATFNLDLSSIGYEYQVAGMCTLPGSGAIHMQYRARAETGREDTLSLWLRRDDGQSGFEEGRIYVVADGDKAHPMLAWREGGVVYYLMGDGQEQVHLAAAALQAPPRHG